MKRLIILKVEEDTLSGKAKQVTVGFFEDETCMEWKILPGNMFDQRIKLEKGMELKMIPIGAL